MPTPSVGVAVISLGDPEALLGLLGNLVPACREFAVDLVVIRRGPPVVIPELDRAGVRVVCGKPGEDEAALRARGIVELGSDITVVTADVEPLTSDWGALLPRLGQLVQLRDDEVTPAEWVGRLRDVGAPDPAA